MTSPSAVQPGAKRLAADLRALERRHSGLNVEALEATQALFMPLHSGEADPGVTVQRDLAYGPDARHRLDVFGPAAAGQPRPILIYVHGGGFVRGDKRLPGQPFHDNIGLWACRNGLVGVTMNYRLAPRDVWPAGPQDVGAAVNWVAANAERFGGDRRRIVVFGHSAGASHVAGYIAHVAGAPDNAGGANVAGAILGAGIYDLTREVSDLERMYFGADPALLAARSSLSGLVAAPMPLMLFVSELDPTVFEDQTLHLVDAIFARRRRLPRLVRLRGENHFSCVMHLGYDPGDSLGPEIIDFVDAECEGS